MLVIVPDQVQESMQCQNAQFSPLGMASCPGLSPSLARRNDNVAKLLWV